MRRRLFTFPVLRLATRTVRALEAIAHAQARLADAAEGRSAPAALTPDAPDDVAISYLDSQDAVAIDQATAQLTPLLGREPTAEELLAVLDGTEFTAADAEAHRARVQAEVARSRRTRSLTETLGRLATGGDDV